MRTDFVECEPNAVIMLDGAYSTRPELADLLDFSVLLTRLLMFVTNDWPHERRRGF